MSHAARDLGEAVRAILARFCAEDAGRSVALSARAPALPLVAVRGDEPRPAASVMKVPMLMALYRSIGASWLDAEGPIPVTAFAPTRYVSILAAFDRERTLSLREICRLALVTSDNPIIVHLQSRIDFGAVNALLREIGVDPVCRMAAGFTDAELGRRNRVNILTAASAVRIMDAIRDDDLYADLMVGLKNNLRNNRIPALLPDHADVYHKTGSLEGVANDVGIVSDGRIDLTIAFLTDAQNDVAATSNEIAACSKEVYDTLSAARGAG